MAAIDKAIQADPFLSDAYRIRGEITKHSYLNVTLAMPDLLKAVDLNPNNFGARADLAVAFMEQGDFESGKEHILIMNQLEPNEYSSVYRWYKGFNPDPRVSVYEPNWEKAILLYRLKTGQLDSLYFDAERLNSDVCRAFWFIHVGKIKEARIIGENLLEASNVENHFFSAGIFANADNKQKAVDILNDIRINSSYVWLLASKVDRMFVPLRDDPRFLEFLDNMGLGKYPMLLPQDPVLPWEKADK